MIQEEVQKYIIRDADGKINPVKSARMAMRQGLGRRGAKIIFAESMRMINDGEEVSIGEQEVVKTNMRQGYGPPVRDPDTGNMGQVMAKARSKVFKDPHRDNLMDAGKYLNKEMIPIHDADFSSNPLQVKGKNPVAMDGGTMERVPSFQHGPYPSTPETGERLDFKEGLPVSIPNPYSMQGSSKAPAPPPIVAPEMGQSMQEMISTADPSVLIPLPTEVSRGQTLGADSYSQMPPLPDLSGQTAAPDPVLRGQTLGIDAYSQMPPPQDLSGETLEAPLPVQPLPLPVQPAPPKPAALAPPPENNVQPIGGSVGLSGYNTQPPPDLSGQSRESVFAPFQPSEAGSTPPVYGQSMVGQGDSSLAPVQQSAWEMGPMNVDLPAADPTRDSRIPYQPVYTDGLIGQPLQDQGPKSSMRQSLSFPQRPAAFAEYGEEIVDRDVNIDVPGSFAEMQQKFLDEPQQPYGLIGQPLQTTESTPLISSPQKIEENAKQAAVDRATNNYPTLGNRVPTSFAPRPDVSPTRKGSRMRLPLESDSNTSTIFDEAGDAVKGLRSSDPYLTPEQERLSRMPIAGADKEISGPNILDVAKRLLETPEERLKHHGPKENPAEKSAAETRQRTWPEDITKRGDNAKGGMGVSKEKLAELDRRLKDRSPDYGKTKDGYAAKDVIPEMRKGERALAAKGKAIGSKTMADIKKDGAAEIKKTDTPKEAGKKITEDVISQMAGVGGTEWEGYIPAMENAVRQLENIVAGRDPYDDARAKIAGASRRTLAGTEYSAKAQAAQDVRSKNSKSLKGGLDTAIATGKEVGRVTDKRASKEEAAAAKMFDGLTIDSLISWSKNPANKKKLTKSPLINSAYLRAVKKARGIEVGNQGAIKKEKTRIKERNENRSDRVTKAGRGAAKKAINKKAKEKAKAAEQSTIGQAAESAKSRFTTNFNKAMADITELDVQPLSPEWPERKVALRSQMEKLQKEYESARHFPVSKNNKFKAEKEIKKKLAAIDKKAESIIDELRSWQGKE